MSHQGWMLPLFVPATRPDSFAKAAASGADAIILDLEDAVDPADKLTARTSLSAARGLGTDAIVRINAAGTRWFEDDLIAVRDAEVAAVMLAKAERAVDIAHVHAVTRRPVIALIETVAALKELEAMATTTGVVQMAFGTMDMAAELGCTPSSPIMLPIRLQILVANVRAELAQPLDGVSLVLNDAAILQSEAEEIAANGFGGRLLIHPAQIEATAHGLAPSEDEVNLARRIVASSGAAVRVDGRMVDRPVRLHAERLLARAERLAAAVTARQIK